MADSEYYVVFEYTEHAPKSTGNRFRVNYQNGEEFKRMHDARDETLRVVSEGLNNAESLRLCDEVPIETMLRSAERRSVESDGRVNQTKRLMHTVNALYAKLSSQ